MSLPSDGIFGPVSDHPELGTDIEAALNGLVESGRYETREQVLREGVRLVQDRETRLARIDAAVSRGIEDAEAGHSEDAEIALTRLRRTYEAIAAKPAA
jgi:antitoxin ParD1/3/4